MAARLLDPEPRPRSDATQGMAVKQGGRKLGESEREARMEDEEGSLVETKYADLPQEVTGDRQYKAEKA